MTMSVPPASASSHTEKKLFLARATECLFDEMHRRGVDEVATRLVSREARVYILAGAVRDALLSVAENRRVAPSDFDIGIQGLGSARFSLVADELGGQVNRYGGYRVYLASGARIDLWRVERTVGLRIHSTEPKIENVLRSFVLSVNAVGLDLLARRIIDLGAISSIRQKQIDLVARPLLHSHGTFAARAILLAFRLSFGISDRLGAFVKSYFDKPAFSHEVEKIRGSLPVGPLSDLLHRGDVTDVSACGLIELANRVRRDAPLP